uniref:Reverse transcriptase domain-containing protein n=1 Tax=Amphimedon queenslandica TaxID=400682 RepID=A0A1X7T8L4_AMPQE
MLINACLRPNVPSYVLQWLTRILLMFCMGCDFSTDQDKQLVKIKSSNLSALGPAIGLLIDLAKQDFSGHTNKLIPVRDVMEVLKETLVLVGNAYQLASFLQEICSEIIGEPSGELFDPTAKKRITEQAQTIKDFKELLRSLDSASKRKSSFKSHFLGEARGQSAANPRVFLRNSHKQSPRRVFGNSSRQAPSISSAISIPEYLEEVQNLLQNGAVELAPDSSGFFSPMFVVPQKDDGSRPIINLKRLNGFLVVQHFKMENILSLRGTLMRNDFMVKLDLKDVYLAIPIHPNHQRFIRFLSRNRNYQFCSLPFRLATAPRVFTKVMKPILASMREKGIHLDG